MTVACVLSLSLHLGARAGASEEEKGEEVVPPSDELPWSESDGECCVRAVACIRNSPDSTVESVVHCANGSKLVEVRRAEFDGRCVVKTFDVDGSVDASKEGAEMHKAVYEAAKVDTLVDGAMQGLSGSVIAYGAGGMLSYDVV